MYPRFTKPPLIPNLDVPYVGVLKGKYIKAQLCSDDHEGRYTKESLDAEMGNLRFSAEPYAETENLRFSAEPYDGTDGFILDVYNKENERTSHIRIDKYGKIRFAESTDFDEGTIKEYKLDKYA